jgi:hypothetical protein
LNLNIVLGLLEVGKRSCIIGLHGADASSDWSLGRLVGHGSTPFMTQMPFKPNGKPEKPGDVVLLLIRCGCEMGEKVGLGEKG